MSAELHIEPTTPPQDWDTFRAEAPPRSIALDGYVEAGPRYDAGGPHLNINHHEEVDRLATLATCEQVLRLIRMGLDRAFSKDGEFAADVFVNDCDQDVCTAWFLLRNIEEVKSVSNFRLNRLVIIEGTLDTTAGAYPYDPELKLLSEIVWIFQPYTEFRQSGEIHKKDAATYRTVIDDVTARIARHIDGQGESIPLDTRYRRIGGNSEWALLKEIGEQGRIGAFADGIDAYVTVLEEGEETYRYAIGRRSILIPFDVPRIIEALNAVEAAEEDRWGGSDIVGGSPRVNGSKLAPQEVEAVVRRVLAE